MKIEWKKRLMPKLGGRTCRRIHSRAKQYCEETSLHGFKYLTKPSYCEKSCWCLVCIVCTILCVLFIYNQMIQYQDNRVTTTVKTTNYPIWKVPFPAVTICNSNVVYKNHTETLAEILENHKIASEIINNYFSNLSLVILNKKMSYDNFDRNDYIQVTKILEAEGFNTEQIMDILAQPCDNMLKKCEWKTSEVDCKKLFKKTKSSGGFCCSFNYKALSSLDDDPNKYVGGVGSSYGLKVYLDAEQSQYMTTTETVGFWILAHNSKDYPDVLVYGTHLELGKQMSLAVRPSIISSRSELRKIDVDIRDCLFAGEKSISWFKEYTFENCLKQCKQNLIWRYCRCIPFYYSIPNVICVMRAERAFVNLRIEQEEGAAENKFVCNCRSACDEISYLSIIQGEQSVSTNLLEAAMMNISVLSVYFQNSGIFEYTRSELTSWDSLLASIGGVIGLFLGGSIMSIIEIIYYCITVIFNHRTSDSKQRKVQKNHPEIYISELYPKRYSSANKVHGKSAAHYMKNVDLFKSAFN